MKFFLSIAFELALPVCLCAIWLFLTFTSPDKTHSLLYFVLFMHVAKSTVDDFREKIRELNHESVIRRLESINAQIIEMVVGMVDMAERMEAMNERIELLIRRTSLDGKMESVVERHKS